MDVNTIASDLIIKARVMLQRSHPFFAYLSQYLTPKPIKGFGTMGVNRKGDLTYDPDWVAKLTLDQMKGVVAHEIMHVAFKHLDYLKAKQANIANISMDIVINDALVTNSLTLPKEGLIPSSDHSINITDKIKVENINKKCWEEVYDELIKKLPKEAAPKVGFDIHQREGDKDEEGGSGGAGAIEDPNAPDWKQLINEAYTYAKMQGKAPAGVDRYVDELNSPQIHWKEYLQKFIIREIPFDFSYSRPSKKSVSIGVFLPSVLRENLDIIVGVDTSGSMGEAELKDCVSEVLGVIKAYQGVTLTVLACDAQVHNVQDVKDEEDLKSFKFTGGGGTDFKPVFKWVEENKPQAKLLLFFTDGYGDFPNSCPEVRTLWVLSKRSIDEGRVPFGEVVKMKDYKELNR